MSKVSALFVRGYVLEKQTAQKVGPARGPTDNNNRFTISAVNSSLHQFASL